MRKKTFLKMIIPVLALGLSGCSANKYMEHFSPVANAEFCPSDIQYPRLIELADKEQLELLLRDDNYVLIGMSSFYDLWVPRTFVVDCAKKYQAELIALSYKVGETVKESTVINVPTRETTYHSGSVYSAYGSVNYYGTSTTYGSTPVVINYKNTYYHQSAYFFAKRKYKNSFGVYFQFPENIPGKVDARTRVAFVAPNSEAEKKGIKAGDIVQRINGKIVASFEDFQPFVLGEEKIHTLEVSHE